MRPPPPLAPSSRHPRGSLSPAPTKLLPVPVHVSYKWNHTIRGFLCLASLQRHRFFFLIVKNLLKVYHFNYFHVHSSVTLSTFTLSCSRHHCHLRKFPSSQTATLPPRGARCPLRPPPALRLADATPHRGEPHGLSFCDWLPSLSGMSSRQHYCQACGGLQHRVRQQPGCGRP